MKVATARWIPPDSPKVAASVGTATVSHPAYRPDIDGLRAIAVLAVVGYHAFPIWVPGGFVGVDIFFVISGFLISTIIFTNLARGTFGFSDFYSRRIRRIFPALILVLAACAGFGWLVMFPDEYEKLGKHILAASGFVANFALLHEAGYFDASADTKPLLHLWSLAVEEQFYIFWPFLVVWVWRRRIDLKWVLWVVAGASFIANVALVGTDRATSFYFPGCRVWELMAGSGLAYSMLRRDPSSPRPLGETGANVATALGIGLIAVAIGELNSSSAFPGWWALLPVAGAFLIIYAGPDASINRKLLSSRILVWFGVISYPLYLWHWPLLSFARIIESDIPSKTIRISAVLLSIALAWLTYRFVERPVRRRPGMVIALALATGMVGTAAFGLVAMTSGGLPRQRHIVPAVALGTMLETTANAKCLLQYRQLFAPKFIDERDFCFTSPIHSLSSDPVFVVGDSHANRIALGLDAIGVSVTNLGRGTCLPFLGYEGRSLQCNPTFDRLIGSFSGVDVSHSTIILTAFFERPYDGRIETTSAGSIRDDARKTLRALAGFHKVVLMLDVPELPFDPRKCMGRPLFKTHANASCTFDASFHSSRIQYEAELKAAAGGLPNVSIYDPTGLFCGPTSCAAAHKGVALYSDRSHLSLQGAVLVATDLKAVLGLQHQ